MRALHLMGLLSDGGVHSSNEHLYRAHSRMPCEAACPMCACMRSWTAATFLRASGKGYMAAAVGLRSSKATDSQDVGARGKRFGALLRHGPRQALGARRTRRTRPSCAQRLAADLARRALSRPCRLLTTQSVTDEFVVPVALSTSAASSGWAMPSCSSTSGPTAHASSHARSSTMSFDGFDRASHPRVNVRLPDGIRPGHRRARWRSPRHSRKMCWQMCWPKPNLRQYHIAETEKYAHVTFFLNGGREEPKEGEQRSLIPSPKVATYDLQPEMSEPAVAQTLGGRRSTTTRRTSTS